MNVFAYFLRNSVIRLLTFVVGVGAVFWVTPHVLRCLGTSAYGTFALIIGLAVYYMLFEFGIYNSIAKKSAEERVKGNQNEIDALYTTGLALGVSSFCVIMALGLGIAVFAVAFFADAEFIGVAQYSIAIFTCSIGISVMARPAFGILAGAMRWNLLAFLAMGRTISTSIGALVFLTPELPAAENLLRMAIVNGLFFAMEGIAMLVAVRMGRHATVCFSSVSMEKIKLLLHFGTPLLVMQIGAILRSRTQIYILAVVLTPAALTFYSLARQFVVYMQDIISNAFGILNPYFSRLQAEGNADGYRHTLLEALRFSYTTSCLIGLGLILYGDAFITRWLGSDFLDVYTILFPLALAGIMEHGEIPAHGFLVGIGKHKVLAQLSLGLGVFITVFSFPAAWLWGFRGIAWVVCLLTLVNCMVLMPPLVSRAAEMPVWRYYRMLLVTLGPQVAAQVAYYYCIREFISPEYISIFLCAIGQTLVCAIVFLISVFHLLRKTHK